MITAQDALNFEPQKAGMNGYRATDVDQFAATVAETLDFQEKKIRELQNKVVELKQNETIIQTTLVNAQKLAMQITEESKTEAQKLTDDASAKAQAQIADAEKKAESIIGDATERAQKLTDETDANIARMTSDAQMTATKLVDDAKAEAEQLKAEVAAEIARENKVLDAIKTEVAKFRTDVLNMYKAQIDLIRDLPDMIPTESVYVAQVAEPEEVEAVAEEPAAEKEEELSVDGAGGDLLKLMNDMDENEKRAAEAVDEVASMSADTVLEGQVSLLDVEEIGDSKTELQFDADGVGEDIPVMPITKREGGFVINFDDDDE